MQLTTLVCLAENHLISSPPGVIKNLEKFCASSPSSLSPVLIRSAESGRPAYPVDIVNGRRRVRLEVLPNRLSLRTIHVGLIR